MNHAPAQPANAPTSVHARTRVRTRPPTAHVLTANAPTDAPAVTAVARLKPSAQREAVDAVITANAERTVPADD